jgi:hypothetical protein
MGGEPLTIRYAPRRGVEALAELPRREPKLGVLDETHGYLRACGRDLVAVCPPRRDAVTTGADPAFPYVARAASAKMRSRSCGFTASP